MSLDETCVEQMLRMVEETVPAPLLAITHSEHPDQHSSPFESASDKEVLVLMNAVYHSMQESKITSKTALERIGVMEPFDRFPEIVQVFKESLQRGDK
jgi:hypothetical protein